MVCNKLELVTYIFEYAERGRGLELCPDIVVFDPLKIENGAFKDLSSLRKVIVSYI